MPTMQEKKKSVYTIITERFVEQLQDGVIPWEKPWFPLMGARVGGWGHNTGRPYTLLNQMMLPAEGEYITYRQIQQEGGRLKKGAKGYPICFWKSYKATQKNNKTNLDEEVTIPVLRYYTVFSIKDCEGIEQKFDVDTSDLDQFRDKATSKTKRRMNKAEKVVSEYADRNGINIKSVAGDSAYYSPTRDEIVVPYKKQFEEISEYYSTLFHEVVHSTGSKSRLNRFGAGAQLGRGQSYALEELVAEVGASSLNYIFGLENPKSIKNNKAYIQSWLNALLNDDKMVVKAASRAQKAVQYIFGDDVPSCNDCKPFVEDVIPDEAKIEEI